jgi:hypothetical protein
LLAIFVDHPYFRDADLLLDAGSSRACRRTVTSLLEAPPGVAAAPRP